MITILKQYDPASAQLILHIIVAICVTRSAILELINMYFDCSKAIN